MKVSKLIEYLNTLHPDAYVEFLDVTHNRRCPVNSATKADKAVGRVKNANGEWETIHHPILELSNRIKRMNQ